MVRDRKNNTKHMGIPNLALCTEWSKVLLCLTNQTEEGAQYTF